MKKIAIVQSNYLPWKGYFDLIAAVDEFILYDDVQFTRRDWRNRNLIKTPSGTSWLTVPVKNRGRFSQLIRETEIDGDSWQVAHWNSLERNYKRAPFFNEVSGFLRPLLLEGRYHFLSELNAILIKTIAEYLGITTKISDSSAFRMEIGKSDRLVSICEQAGGREYFSGPSAKKYLDEEVFRQRGISVVWFDYGGYPPYQQLWGNFLHEVSVVDLIFNCGPRSGKFMRYVNSLQ